MPDKNKSNVCLVCGNRATGSHFNAITCESCKSFFRRNALNKADIFKCFLGGNCLIDRKDRNICKKCRLDKCFAVGMKTNLFFTEEQKQLRKSIIESNRKRKLSDTSVTTNEIAVSTSSLSPQTSATFNDEITCDTSFENLLTDLNNFSNDSNSYELYQSVEPIIAPITDHSNTSTTFSDEIDLDISFANILQQDNNLNNAVNDTNLNNLNQSVVPIVRPITDYSNTFNELEGIKLSELLNGMNILAIPAATDGNRLVLNTFNDAIKIMVGRQETEIPKIIKMCKTMGAFKALCENDQMILIKYAGIPITIMRMILFFDFEMQAWNVTNNNQICVLKLDALRHNLFSKMDYINPYFNHKNFLSNMGLDWDSETLIIDLLTAIILFNPDRPKLTNKSFIKHQQNIYIHLLQRFLQMKYRSECLSHQKLNRLINNLKDLCIIDRKICFVTKHMPAINKLTGYNVQFPQICLELFDR